MDWGNPLNKSTVPNITKVALVSCNQNSPCLMTTVLPSARGDRDECVCACVYAQLCLTPCDPIDCSPPDSSVHGISQARILEWVAIPLFRASIFLTQGSNPVSCIAGGFFPVLATREAHIIVYLIYIAVYHICESVMTIP